MKALSAREVAVIPSLLFLLLSLPASLPAQTYSIADIASDSWSYSEAHGINGVGSVVGEFEATNFFYVLAFLYTNGAITELGHLGGTPYAVAYGANGDAVVGESDTANSTHAFLYKNGAMTDLGILGNNNVGGYSSAHAINTAGAIVGEASLSFNQASTIHAILYNGNTKTDLGALGGDYSSANAINNSNVIVGESDIVQQGVTNVHAFVYTNAIHDLGTLGGGYSSAKGINDSGVIVGEAETVIGGVTYLRAFLFRNGVMTDLGTLGGTVSSASAINSSGQIVGYATDTNEVSNAFLYDGSRMLNLNNFIPASSAWTNLTSADAINDAGQIAGSGYLIDGSFHAYLLTPGGAGTPTVSITQPAPNANFQAPASFLITASASVSGGTVTNVQFLINNNVISNATVAPYSATANNLGAGTYTLTAIASDDAGVTASDSLVITVTSAADVPPTVTITNPSENSSFQAPASFIVSASASDSDGSVTNVQFLVNNGVIGNATSPPFSASASGLSAGSYTVAAIASDNAGLRATNAISISVTNSISTPVSILSPSFGANGFSFSFATQSGLTYQAQFSGSLTNNWLVFTNVIGNGSTASVTDATAPRTKRYYRVLAQ